MVVLKGGLHAWEEAGFPTVAITGELPPNQLTAEAQLVSAKPTPTLQLAAARAAAHTHTFLPGLAQTYLTEQTLPIRKELSILFVDMADSTATIVNQPPEVALALVQRFMEVVTEVALANCGDVKDYEGDGALLYFESVTEATQAALAIRKALQEEAVGSRPTLALRLSLNVGSVIIGVIGTALRRSVALISPSINLAARLLKQIPPGGIIATVAAVEQLRHETPQLAARFQLWKTDLELKGFTDERVTAFYIPEQTRGEEAQSL